MLILRQKQLCWWTPKIITYISNSEMLKTDKQSKVWIDKIYKRNYDAFFKLLYQYIMLTQNFQAVRLL